MPASKLYTVTMKRGHMLAPARVAGYTIIEVMIVLAVTTTMFVAIAATFRGRQAAAEFTQGVRGYETMLQDIMSDVVNGTYSPIECTSDAATGSPQFGAGGQDGRCVFLGKAIANGLYQSGALTNNPRSSYVYTIVGRRYMPNSVDVEVQSIADARATYDPNNIVTYEHGFQLAVSKVVVRNPPTYDQVLAFGYGVPVSGVTAGGKLAYLLGTTTGAYAGAVGPDGILNSDAEFQAVLQTISAINQGVIVCLIGQNGQRAEISIESNGQVNSVLDTKVPVAGEACHVTT